MELFKEFLRKTGIGLKEYLKSELITSAICFALLLIGLYIGDVPYFGLVAFVIAAIDMLPVLGSGIVLIPWSIIAFVQANHKLAFILIIIFVLTFVIEQVVQPLIFGKSVGLKPIYTILITIISMIVFSPALGAIIGSIVSIIIAVIIDIKSTYKRSH